MLSIATMANVEASAEAKLQTHAQDIMSTFVREFVVCFKDVLAKRMRKHALKKQHEDWNLSPYKVAGSLKFC